MAQSYSWFENEGSNHDTLWLGRYTRIAAPALYIRIPAPAVDTLWLGSWEQSIDEIAGSVTLKQEDVSTGLEVTRTFHLSATTSELTISSSYKSTAAGRIELNHWGRTFVPGGGIVLIPLAPLTGRDIPLKSRFPLKYVTYNFDTETPENSSVCFLPKDANICVRDDFVEVLGHTREAANKCG